MNKNLRNMLGYLAANTLILTGRVKQATRKALDTECILSLYYHKPGKDEFEFSIKWLKSQGFNFISPHDLERVMNREIPFPKGAVLLTVDDGWQTNVTNVVEVANRNQVPVTIFVSTTPAEEGTYWWSYVTQAKRQGLTSFSKHALKKMPEEERLKILKDIKQMIYPGRDAMTVDQVKMVANSPYVTIGSHTQTHPILINCPEMQVYEELKGSRQKLESWIGKEVVYFAYPNGDYSRREIKILKTLNYRLAFSAQPQYLTPALLNESFTIPRFGFLEGASSAENICRMTGVWQPMMRKLTYRGDAQPKKDKRWFKDLFLGEDRIQKLDL
ncbi:polysaccharide deacetylase [Niastella yeongjuensis]|uniref:Polysaccharide deacetylase n=1 Tax=Niastella yeongjuensis TaxID=354355 RepID=A0A1V9F3K8_9BACT|nr:polysaccharide deacetylase family protein [Niastella yeongjuensis]OQP52846.1 polysaccharide deacetylase [Niastella yeongjuensis]SEP21008.1 Polysaccharide deacetylase [Niastella yeongjuensis]